MPKVVTRTESSAVVRQESTTRRVISDNPRIARVVAAGGQGPRGIQGLSSYEVWLAAGNSGTVDDFMEAIRGPIGTVTAEDVRNAVGYVPEVSGAAASAQAAAIASAQAYTDGEVDALKAGVPIEGDTLSKLHTRISALQLLLTSDDVSLDSLQEVVTFVKEHEYDLTLLGMSKVNVADIINDLITPATDKPLAAAQGKILKELVDTLSANLQSLANAADPFPQYATTEEAAAAAPVQSVAGRAGAVVLTKEDVGLPYADNTPDTDKPVSTAQATAISAAQAAAIAAAQSDVDTKIAALKGAVPSDGDTLAKLRSLIGGLQAVLTSDDVNLDSLQEVVSFIKDHESDLTLLSGSKVNVTDIVNLLTSSAVDKPLSAAQGKALKDLLDALTAVVATKEPAIASGATTQYFRGDKIWRTFATDVRAATLAGLSTASSAVISVTDTVLGAFGKLQAQITSLLSSLNAHAALRNPHGTTATDVGADPVGSAAAAQASAILAAAADATAKIDALKGGVGTDGDTLAKLRGLITNIQTLLTSDDVSLDTIQEIVTFVKDHEGDLALLGTSKVNISDIVNTLSDTSINKPLSAAQGKVLNDMLDALTTVVSGKEPSIAGGSTAQYWRGDKVWRDFAADVRMVVLTGLSTASAAVVTAADSVLGAIGKLQAQISDVITQTEAETGTSTTRRSWTSQRVRQAAAAWWEAVKGTLTGPVAITANSASDALRVTQTGAGNALVIEDSASPDTSPVVVTGAGNVVIGASAPRNIGVTPIFSLEGLGSSGSTMLITRNSADTSPSTFRAVKSRGAANGALDAIGSSDSILQMIAYGTDGTGHDQAASVIFGADGAVSTGIVPGKIVFYTANSAGVLTEVFRIDSSQVLALTSGKLKLALDAGVTKLLQSDASGNAAWGPAVGQADAALPTNSDLRAYYGIKYNPGILPTFEMDFENARFSLYDAGDDGVYSTSRHFDEFAAWFSTDMQITRASTQTYFDALGNMREAPAGTVRCDHDPLTGRKLGVYVGGSRANQLYPSSGFSVSNATSGGTIARGLLSLTEYTESTATTTRVVSGIAGSTFWEVGVRKTLSCYAMAKAGSAQRYLIMRDSTTLVGAVFDLVTGAVHSVGSGWSATSQDLGGGLFRMSATYTNTGAAAVAATIAMSPGTNPAALTYAGDGVSGAWLGGVQGEPGSISPLILTTASQVTRAATTITVGGTKFAGLFGFTEATLVAKAIAADVMTATDRRICLLSDGTVNNRFSLHINGSSIRVYANSAGAFLYGPAVGTAFAGVPFSVALSGKSGLYAAACKGVAAAEGLVSGFGAFNRVQIGYGVTSQQFDGWMQSVALYPHALSSAQLAELSK